MGGGLLGFGYMLTECDTKTDSIVYLVEGTFHSPQTASDGLENRGYMSKV